MLHSLLVVCMGGCQIAQHTNSLPGPGLVDVTFITPKLQYARGVL